MVPELKAAEPLKRTPPLVLALFFRVTKWATQTPNSAFELPPVTRPGRPARLTATICELVGSEEYQPAFAAMVVAFEVA